jgi:hypothetical protein
MRLRPVGADRLALALAQIAGQISAEVISAPPVMIQERSEQECVRTARRSASTAPPVRKVM